VIAREGEYVPISCADYEPLEVACMDRYAVELATRDGRTIVGIAVELAVRPPEEFLVVRHDDGTTEDVRVDQIRHMVVLSRPCRFSDHSFAAASPTLPSERVRTGGRPN
jgi:Rho-binding antiterminator